MLDFVNWSKLNTPAEWLFLSAIAALLAWAIWAWVKRTRVQNNETLDAKTIKTLTDNNAALEERLRIVEQETKDCKTETAQCQKQHSESLKLIHTLQGELNTYKELVLIPKDFIKELQRNQTEIIKLLKGDKK